MLPMKMRPRAPPSAQTMSDFGGVSHSKTSLMRSVSTDHVDASQAPALESVTSQVIIERLQTLERTMESLRVPEQTPTSPGGHFTGGSVYSDGISTLLPSYEGPPPSWHP